MKTYAGVGSRKAPEDVLKLMEKIARRLAELGWTLRTGGAEGADQAFERGARAGGGAVEVFLPWPGYNGYREGALKAPSSEAVRLAAALHPAWNRLSQGVQKLMARNSHQVLGAGLEVGRARGQPQKRGRVGEDSSAGQGLNQGAAGAAPLRWA